MRVEAMSVGALVFGLGCSPHVVLPAAEGADSAGSETAPLLSGPAMDEASWDMNVRGWRWVRLVVLYPEAQQLQEVADELAARLAENPIRAVLVRGELQTDGICFQGEGERGVRTQEYIDAIEARIESGETIPITSTHVAQLERIESFVELLVARGVPAERIRVSRDPRLVVGDDAPEHTMVRAIGVLYLLIEDRQAPQPSGAERDPTATDAPRVGS